MIFTTEQLTAFDECERKFTFLNNFDPPRVPLAAALYKSLAEGLKSGMPEKAEERLLRFAANPGLGISGHNVYEIAIHHAKLLRLITAYLLSTSAEEAGNTKWKRADTVSLGDHSLRPQSYHLRDGRLRRVVLCSSWGPEREADEKNSWRSMGDIVALNRPMLVNVIIIGPLRTGFRYSPWTRGHLHPQNGGLRIRLNLDDKGKPQPFSDKWEGIFREHSQLTELEWLKQMQSDKALEDVVKSFEVPVPRNAREIRADLERLMREMATLKASASLGETRRASCYRAFAPCQFSPVCPRGFSDPRVAGFRPK